MKHSQGEPGFDAGRAAERGAALIAGAFETWHRGFLMITRRAKVRFETRNWAAAREDAQERLALYSSTLTETIERVFALLGRHRADEALWASMRTAYAGAVLGHPASEVAETFFNSVTRRVFGTVGTNSAVEFLDFRFERVSGPLNAVPWRNFTADPDARPAARALLISCGFAAPFADLERDTELVADRIERAWQEGAAPHALESLEMLESVFYRRKGAYLVGRVRGGNRIMPLVLALVSGPEGISVDAVLLTEAEASVVFSFTRSHFQVDVLHPSDTIAFLRGLMPLKPVAELYTALGYHKHGKTEFYRDLMRHLMRSSERFDFAPGARGLVMEVFAMPGFDAVFKIIRDSFPPPKQTTPGDVRRRYAMVFGHDRAGRLVDAQEFMGLAFPRDRFAPQLLEALLTSASRTVRIEGDQVAFSHLYAERRVRPLDLFMTDARPGAVLSAALDYGQAIRDLASTGIFPGDILPKNFGVTRHGRVVFYDYDELRLLSECTFRDIPEPANPEDELADEPWYHVGADDVFPGELAAFIPFHGEVRDAYLAAHGALYTAAWWRGIQTRVASGDLVDVYPYPGARRL